ncbi:MAG TPA: ABC transporter ATP-binding protein [Bacilli bacterium]|nr:ABC transporter ATP-binding protein [Bacilli bacterium]
MTTLHTEQLNLSYEDNTIIRELDLQVPAGQITALVGRNGCGKSTLLKAMARLLKPAAGQVYLDGKAIHTLPTKEVAKQLAILPQSPTAPEGLTVEGLVRQGRYPHLSMFGQRTEEDDRMVRWALEATHMTELRHRDLAALSGGQRQRAWIAMALAQGTDLLLLDEPTTYLDMAHQLEVLELLQELNRDQGKTIVMVVHDLNHATRYAGHMIAVNEGTVVAAGAPRDIMTPQLMLDVFGVHAYIEIEEESGIPICVPYKLATSR